VSAAEDHSDLLRDALDNVEVALLYLEAWLGGSGAVGIHNLMEDAATAEIARSQVWQWLHGGVTLADGETVTRELVARLVEEELERLGADASWNEAVELFTEMALSETYVDFLTLPAYERMP
jgi:malate synthase